ncbi:hypothetical protein KUIN1_49370 [Pseudomonas sp. KUIN-1]|nr:hypothetical protein KUIN1_49370 [Pseudomonas sp. KUIN-1]
MQSAVNPAHCLARYFAMSLMDNFGMSAIRTVVKPLRLNNYLPHAAQQNFIE